MADEVEDKTDDKPADDAVTDEVTEDTADETTEEVVETPGVEEITEPNYAAQIEDLTKRVNAQSDQIEVLIGQVKSLQDENADLIEGVASAETPVVTDSHNTGDPFMDDLFN